MAHQRSRFHRDCRRAPYLEDGCVEIDNNLVENAVRPIKLEARNHLFFGSKRGGELAAVAYTLVEGGSAKADQLTPATMAARLAKASAA